MNRLQKNIALVIVIALIVITIFYLESKKAGHFLPGNSDTNIIPISTSTLSNSSSSTAALSKEDLQRILQEKSQKYDRVRELVNPQGFINTGPFHIADYVGKKVILIDFWTYSCINCQRTLPYLNAWYDKYEKDGLVIIGVHSPEFEFEKNYDNVKRATEKFGIKYPIVLDSNMDTWNAYQNRFWPAHYLVDVDGFIVEKHIGEGGYTETEKKIQDLLKERSQRLGTNDQIAGGTVNVNYSIDTNSPETYFGYARNELLANGTKGQPGAQNLTLPSLNNISANALYLEGKWFFSGEYATNNSSAQIVYKYTAKDVYLVAESRQPITITIKKDGVEVKKVTVQNADLYPLIQDSKMETHILEIIIDSPGLQAYTFTFG